ncbi:torsin-1A-like [Pollicipes pollicipes]|uniref:torsin-1A-like n=1 Tax=Pollicipes pollicipes TaxID=41117 RepID=UPI001885561D|nr:torsin-1A-like [Pollicipes pollicipes]XP_037076775.1 torsin-1A-like [Pollicipes pollicipes]
MLPGHWMLSGVLVLLAPVVSFSLDPLSVGASVGFIYGLTYVWDAVRDAPFVRRVAETRAARAIDCAVRECCAAPYVINDMQALRANLSTHLHGQHLVGALLPKVIGNHMAGGHARKPLVISMHGTTGVGKNYVSQLVADSLFKNGMQSRFVHLFVGSLDFPYSDEASVERYATNLRQWVLGNLSSCEHSLFIFDEVDKIPAGVLSGIKPYLDFHGELRGVRISQAIFLLLSNTGGKAVNKLMLQRWSAGLRREDTALEDFQTVVAERAFSELGGLYRSDIVSAALVDVYLPFLPLERRHVRLCVLDELRRRRVTRGIAEAVEHVLRKVRFDSEQQLFAKSGCKDVANKVNFVVDHSMFDEI